MLSSTTPKPQPRPVSCALPAAGTLAVAASCRAGPGNSPGPVRASMVNLSIGGESRLGLSSLEGRAELNRTQWQTMSNSPNPEHRPLHRPLRPCLLPWRGENVRGRGSRQDVDEAAEAGPAYSTLKFTTPKPPRAMQHQRGQASMSQTSRQST